MSHRHALVFASLLAYQIPSYASTPVQPATGTRTGVLRIAGNPQLKLLVERWISGFSSTHPNIRFTTRLTGSDTGMAALYTGKADITLLGRAPTAREIKAFQWIFGYKPAQIEVATGSVGRPGRSPALVVFVHRGNPLRQLSLKQLGAIFGTRHRLSQHSINYWGQLGLKGQWRDRPIHLYMPDATSGTGRFFREAVLGGSGLMNWRHMHEFRDSALTGAEANDAGGKVISALALDRHGLAIASLDDENNLVQPVALRTSKEPVPIVARRQTISTRKYPLSRAVYVCFNQRHGTRENPAIGNFLKFVLSHGETRQMAANTGYVALTHKLSSKELRRLAMYIDVEP